MSARVLTAHAPTPSLVRSLSRAGWGPLLGREWGGVRAVLRALGDSLDDRTGQGAVTVAQVAQRASLSPRWTSRCMGVLEDVGLIRWTRGGITPEGRPAPSAIRLDKRALVELIRQARPMRDAADAARRQATRARLAAAAFVRGPQHRRRSAHAALSSSLPTLSGGGALPPAHHRTATDTEDDDMRQPWAPPVDCHVPAHAERGFVGGHVRLKDGSLVPRCPLCRDEEQYAAPSPRADVAARVAADKTLWTD